GILRRGQPNRSLLVSLPLESTIPLLVPHTAVSLSLPGNHLAPLHAQESWHRCKLDLALLTASAAPPNGIIACLRFLRNQAGLGRPAPERLDARTQELI